MGGGRRAADSRDAPLLADLDREVEQGVVDGAVEPAAPLAAVERAGCAATPAQAPDAGAPRARRRRPRRQPIGAVRRGAATRQAAGARGGRARRARGHRDVGSRREPEAARPGPARARGLGPELRPQRGHRQGPVDAWARVGLQVAAVRKVADGYLLVPLEGDTPPHVNGVPVARRRARRCDPATRSRSRACGSNSLNPREHWPLSPKGDAARHRALRGAADRPYPTRPLVSGASPWCRAARRATR